MHVAGLIFLWLNRIYFIGLIVLHVAGHRLPEGVTKQHGTAQLIISVWQIFGTFLVVALGRSPST